MASLASCLVGRLSSSSLDRRACIGLTIANGNPFLLEEISQIQPVVSGRLGRLDRHDDRGFPKFVHRFKDALIQLLEPMLGLDHRKRLLEHAPPDIDEAGVVFPLDDVHPHNERLIRDLINFVIL